MTAAALLEIHDISETGQLKVGLSESGERRESAPVGFALTLTDEERAALDRYHQEHVRPTIGSVARVEALEAVMRNLGRLLFETAFGSGSQGREFLDEVLAREDRGELVIISDRSEFLSLPWELMNDAEIGYFINGLAGVVRQSVADVPVGVTEERVDEALHVLMLSASPVAGEAPTQGPLLGQDVVSGGNLASATVAALEGLNTEASLDNPRPATLGAMQGLLERNPNHYHIAHIDGATLDEDGNILLEDARGEAEAVAPDRLGAALAAGGVEVALISAGAQSQEVPMRLWSDVGAGIAAAGVAQVAVLPAPLHRDAAETSMRAFYTRLAQGNAVSTAVSSIRRGLMDTPERTSVYGKRVFWDWQLPAVYQSKQYVPPTIAQHQPDPAAPPVIHPEEAPTDDLQIPAQGQHGLVGRQAELRQLERALQSSSVALLSGDTGTGKTELALGLCRWFLKPARVAYPGGVFYTVFEASQPAGLERVVHEIGTAVAGLDFADMRAEQQRQWVLQYLQQNPCLLVWDNVENVAGFPDGNAGLLEESELPALGAFLGEATTGPVGTSALLLSRRDTEDWLTMPYASLTLDGLAQSDRMGLAAALMEASEVPVTRAGADFGELLELLDGHPLAMQMAIPPVKEVPASVVTGELRRLMDEQAGGEEPGRSPVLTAAMEYAFSRMSRRKPHASAVPGAVPTTGDAGRAVAHHGGTGVRAGDGGRPGSRGVALAADARRRVAVVGTFLRIVSHAVAAGAGGGIPGTDIAERFPDQSGDAVVPGAQTGRTGGRQRHPATGAGIREGVRRHGGLLHGKPVREPRTTGTTAVLAEEGNLTQALGLALEYQQWDNAQLLIQPLAQVYRMQKRFPELRRLRGQLLDTIGHTAAEAEANGAVEFWQYLLGTDSMESVEIMDLERAEGFNERLLAYLLEQPGGDTDERTAAVYHQNGLIATRRGQYDAASEWLEKGLEIIDGGEDQESIADACFAIGQVRHHQRQYSAAKEWYTRALDIHQRLPDYEEMGQRLPCVGFSVPHAFRVRRGAKLVQPGA